MNRVSYLITDEKELECLFPLINQELLYTFKLIQKVFAMFK